MLKNNNFIIIILINVLIAATVSILLNKLTPERNIIKLEYTINVENKYFDLLNVKGLYARYKRPENFIRELDENIKYEYLINEIKNSCISIDKIKSTLPVSFILDHDKIFIEIISKNYENSINCSYSIRDIIESYNINVRRSLEESITFTTSFGYKKNQDYNELKINEFVHKIEDQIIENQTNKNESELYNYIFLLINYIISNDIQNDKLLDLKNIKEQVIENISPLKFIGEKRTIETPPNTLKLFISVFFFGILLTLLIRLISLNSVKKIFK